VLMKRKVNVRTKKRGAANAITTSLKEEGKEKGAGGDYRFPSNGRGDVPAVKKEGGNRKKDQETQLKEKREKKVHHAIKGKNGLPRYQATRHDGREKKNHKGAQGGKGEKKRIFPKVGKKTTGRERNQKNN